jgi:hypothetical protein
MVFNACFVPIIYFFYPETAGKTLEELDLLYATAGRNSISVAVHSHKGAEIPEGSLALRRSSSAGATINEKDKTLGKGEASHAANGVV